MSQQAPTLPCRLEGRPISPAGRCVIGRASHTDAALATDAQRNAMRAVRRHRRTRGRTLHERRPHPQEPRVRDPGPGVCLSRTTSSTSRGRGRGPRDRHAVPRRESSRPTDYPQQLDWPWRAPAQPGQQRRMRLVRSCRPSAGRRMPVGPHVAPSSCGRPAFVLSPTRSGRPLTARSDASVSACGGTGLSPITRPDQPATTHAALSRCDERHGDRDRHRTVSRWAWTAAPTRAESSGVGETTVRGSGVPAPARTAGSNRSHEAAIDPPTTISSAPKASR